MPYGPRLPAAVRAVRRALPALDGAPFVAEMRGLRAGDPYFDAGRHAARAARDRGRSARAAGPFVTVAQSCADQMLALQSRARRRGWRCCRSGFDPGAPWRCAGRRLAVGERATLVHAGTLHGDRSAVTLMRALSRPELAARARLVLLGAVDPLTTAALPHARCEVVVEPPAPWRAAVERVRDADVAVVINSPGTGGDMAAPSKLYEALALGTPVLALTNPASETERLLQRLGHDAGCAPPGDEEAVARAVGRLLDAPPPAVEPAALAPFNRAAVAEQVAALLDRLAS